MKVKCKKCNRKARDQLKVLTACMEAVYADRDRLLEALRQCISCGCDGGVAKCPYFEIAAALVAEIEAAKNGGVTCAKT